MNIPDLTAHYFRQFEGENYLVPESAIEGFDKICNKIDNESNDKKKYKLYDDFNEWYQNYKCEGELYNTKLFIQD